MSYVAPPTVFPPAHAGQPAFELTWELFGELCRVLALRVAREFDPEVVIGIATAGVLPAAVIASILRVDFFSLKISRREQGEVVHSYPRLMSAAPPQVYGKRVLIVDEITTSGDTLRLALAAVREVGPAEVRTAASFVKPGGYRPDYFALETGSLIVFPWDRQVISDDGELVVHPGYAHAITA
ncbi:MAG TPA: phosphoribosyltransferase family protein [Longimicrobiaceae bacterium]|nr:phosphoribosyltransferase family protein [Longimicrobiaceae bacterium]